MTFLTEYINKIYMQVFILFIFFFIPILQIHIS